MVDLAGIDLPPAGRLVSCAVCGGIWRAFPDPPASAEALADGTVDGTPIPPPDPVPSVPAAGIVVPPVPSQVAASLRRTGMALALVLVIAAGLMAARDYLAVWLPASRGLFSAIGATTLPSEVAVELVAIAPLDGAMAFRVTYEIVNGTALSRPLPTVCATGRDRAAERLFQRCFAGDTHGIPSHATRRFSFVVADLAAPLADLDLDIKSKKE